MITASAIDGLPLGAKTFPSWIQGTSVNSTIEMCVHHFTNNLRTVFRHGHGPSVHSVLSLREYGIRVHNFRHNSKTVSQEVPDLRTRPSPAFTPSRIRLQNFPCIRDDGGGAASFCAVREYRTRHDLGTLIPTNGRGAINVYDARCI